MSNLFMMEHSCETAKPELELFSNLPTQSSLDDGYYEEIGSKNSLSDGPISFDVNGDGNDYMDLNNSYLMCEVKVTKGDGGDLDDGERVGCVNGLLHSLFNQVVIKLNDTIVSENNNTYHYRAHLENLLSFGAEAKRNQLSAGLWYKDTAGHMDDVDEANAGNVKRKEHISKSKNIQLMGRIHSEVFLQDRYLINGVDMTLKLTRNSNQFCLMAADNSNYKVKIMTASFYVRKVKVNSAVQLKHIEKMDKQLTPAIYPIRRVEVKSFGIGMGSLSASEEGIFSGQLPKRVVIGFVESAAYDGRYAKNPYNFKHFDLKHISLYCEGKQIPATPYQPNFTNGNSLRSYLSLYEVSGKLFQDTSLDITREEYANGYTLYGFDLTPDLSESGCFHLIKKGSIRLELKFASQIPTPVNCILYAEFDSAIKIDKNRQVLVEHFA